MTFPPEWFYHACDKSYQLATEHLPQAVRDRPMTTAFLLGTSAAYGTVAIIEKGLKRFLGERAEKIMPTLERIGLYSTVAVPLAITVLDPEFAKNLPQEHPVYTAGCLGLIAGSARRALEDLGVFTPLEKHVQQLWAKLRKTPPSELF
ncbi:MAG TPA: hypothetical protein VJG90_03730 [Candidatus Nanoarchaeia archaeon]|nr:hypothetical protein [Candidatus Nanoarchaeia archaeon]